MHECDFSTSIYFFLFLQKKYIYIIKIIRDSIKIARKNLKILISHYQLFLSNKFRQSEKFCQVGGNSLENFINLRETRFGHKKKFEKFSYLKIDIFEMILFALFL